MYLSYYKIALEAVPA